MWKWDAVLSPCELPKSVIIRKHSQQVELTVSGDKEKNQAETCGLANELYIFIDDMSEIIWLACWPGRNG